MLRIFFCVDKLAHTKQVNQTTNMERESTKLINEKNLHLVSRGGPQCKVCSFSNWREARNVSPANGDVLRLVQGIMPNGFKAPALALPKSKFESLIFADPKLPEIRAV